MDKEKLANIIEALLFATDKPLPLNVLAEVIEKPVSEIKEGLEKLDSKLKGTEAPIKLEQIAGGYQLVTYPEYAQYIKKLYKNKLLARLSKPALEVLAIIAYKQPVTKQEVELIRGVNSDGVYHTLLERKLIKIVGRKDSPGRPLLYGTTKEFLQYLGINSLDDLPKMEEVKNILEKEEYIENWQQKIDNEQNQQISLFDENEIKNRPEQNISDDVETQIKETKKDEDVTETEENIDKNQEEKMQENADNEKDIDIEEIGKDYNNDEEEEEEEDEEDEEEEA